MVVDNVVGSEMLLSDDETVYTRGRITVINGVPRVQCCISIIYVEGSRN